MYIKFKFEGLYYQKMKNKTYCYRKPENFTSENFTIIFPKRITPFYCVTYCKELQFSTLLTI